MGRRGGFVSDFLAVETGSGLREGCPSNSIIFMSASQTLGQISLIVTSALFGALLLTWPLKIPLTNGPLLLILLLWHGLLISGTNRTAFESISSPAEHQIATTTPSDLIDLDNEDDDEEGEDEL